MAICKNKRCSQISVKIVLGILVGITSACNLLDNPTIPDGTKSPTMYHSKEGGMGLYVHAEWLFSRAVIQSLLSSGLMSDELNSNGLNTGHTDMDSRADGNTMSASEYANLHQLRGQSQMARGVLERFGGDVSPAIRGRLLIMEAFTVLMLADQFCSGVNLSTLDFNADYTYKQPLTTRETYSAAVALFDSALLISSDSSNLMTLAKLGKARALVGASDIEQAYEISQSIPTEYSYIVNASFIYRISNGTSSQWNHRFATRASVSDSEGINGMPYRSSNDPRSLTDYASISPTSSKPPVGLYYPRKYVSADSFPYPLATGVEARLIEAEYMLKNGRNREWLDVINTLRTDGTVRELIVNSDLSVDTLWNPGTGQISSLPLLVDPSTPQERLKLLFDERAYWLFLTGQRLPDLRRLVRQYGLAADDVFPIGPYVFGSPSNAEYYGQAINLPIPVSTETSDGFFRGCLSRDT